MTKLLAYLQGLSTIFTTRKNLKEFLDLKAEQYEGLDFIEDDPIQIPHGFSSKEDIEISGFLTSIIAWGQRKTIINNSEKLIELMEGRPHEFLMTMKNGDLDRFSDFVHRTFNGVDCKFFIHRLSELYHQGRGLEGTLGRAVELHGAEEGISMFKEEFFQGHFQTRSLKHLADPIKGSSAKRINMFLRWMTRPSDKGVDFGLWQNISTSQLSMPLDIHTGNVARSLKLLKRPQNDWKAVSELDTILRRFDKKDPVKYDFALFGLGVNEDWRL
jgi:uncharacterized protein (TIGR02757 family)